MANHFPASADGQVTQLTYMAMLRENVQMAGNPYWTLAGEAQPVFQVSFNFPYNYVNGQLQVDYIGFDQDQVEQILTEVLEHARESFMVSVSAWGDSIMVSRDWSFQPNVQGSLVVPSMSGIDSMPYVLPPPPDGDYATATDGGESIVVQLSPGRRPIEQVSSLGQEEHRMPDTLERTQDGIKWFPRVTVEKYSIDQTEYAERKLREELSWGRRIQVRAGLYTPRLHGDWLRELFSVPEDGYARSEGNLLVNTGLNNLVAVLIGKAASGSSGYPLVPSTGSGPNGAAGVGVGTNNGGTTQAAAVTDTHLYGNAGAEGAGYTWYQIMDSGYPNASTGTGLLSGQSTFVSGNANMAWNEWCWTTGGGAVTTAGSATLAGLYATASSAAMVNHKVTALGSKASGASWVFSCTIQFS